jgi:putative transposase
MSQRRAGLLIGINRSTMRYKTANIDETTLRQRLKELAQKYRRWGSPMLHRVLRREGLVLNHKRTERIYREEGLSLRTKWRKKRPTIRVQMPPATEANQIWAMDFINDCLASGRKIKTLSLIDECTKECLALESDTSISGVGVVRILESVVAHRGYPKAIRTDNGPEFTSRALFEWCDSNHVEHIFSDPGKPTQNPFVESFHDKFRKELLNEHWFLSLKEFRAAVGSWRSDYNDFRPHSTLNGLTPTEFAQKMFKEQVAQDAQQGSLTALTA